MNQKQLQNEVFIKSKRHIEEVKRKLAALDKKTVKKEATMQTIKFKPLAEKVTESEEEIREELPEERLVVAADIKTLVPTERKEVEKTVEAVTAEEPIAKKVDLKELPQHSEVPLWERTIEFPVTTIPEIDVEVPEFPIAPYEEIEKLLGTPIEEDVAKESEVIEISPVEPKKKPRAELVEEFIKFYDEEPSDTLKARNIEASEEFKTEMKENSYLYNIVRKVPKFVKAPFKTLKKLGDRIMHSITGKLKTKKIREKILEYTDEDILVLNDAFEEKESVFPTAAKVMVAEEKEKRTSLTEELNVDILGPTVESLNQQLDEAFRSLGKTEEEIAKIHEEAEAKVKARIEREKKGYCTTEEEILAQVQSVLNERKTQSSAKK